MDYPAWYTVAEDAQGTPGHLNAEKGPHSYPEGGTSVALFLFLQFAEYRSGRDERSVHAAPHPIPCCRNLCPPKGASSVGYAVQGHK